MWKKQLFFAPSMNVGLGNSPLDYGPALNFCPVICETFQWPFFFSIIGTALRRWLFAQRTDLCLLRGGRVCPLEGGELAAVGCDSRSHLTVLTSEEWPACGSEATKLLAISPYRQWMIRSPHVIWLFTVYWHRCWTGLPCRGREQTDIMIIESF